MSVVWKVAMFFLVGLLFLAEWTVLVWHSVMTDGETSLDSGFYVAKNLFLLLRFALGVA